MRSKLLHPILLISIGALFIISCKKEIHDRTTAQEEFPSSANINSQHGHLKQTKTFPSTVAQKWIDLQVRMLRLPAGPNIYTRNGHRYFGYCGIALYESVVPGMPGYQSLVGQLTDMPAMPTTEPGKSYHWPAAANAALAFLSRSFFTAATADQKRAIDSLENALNQEYQSDLSVNAAEFQRSVNFGKTIAQRIFDWSKTDGSATVYPTYVPPVGPGLWAPTPPNFPQADGPYWRLNRPMVAGSLEGTWPPPPPAYSTDPNSTYYAMVKEVYDISQALTPQQTATALYFRDNPGFQAGTLHISVWSDHA